MAIEEALTALLSSVAGGRRFWDRAPQSNTGSPFLVMHNITQIRGITYAGVDGYKRSIIQVDIKGATKTEVKTAREAIETIVSGYQGTSSGIYIQGMFMDGPRSVQPAAVPGSTDYPFMEQVDLEIHHD
jgi:hypothetical protein